MQMKETEELIQGVVALSFKIFKHINAGVKWADIPTKLLAESIEDQEFVAKMDAAYQDSSLIPSEIKKMTAMDGLHLTAVAAKSIIAELTKEKK